MGIVNHHAKTVKYSQRLTIAIGVAWNAIMYVQTLKCRSNAHDAFERSSN